MGGSGSGRFDPRRWRKNRDAQSLEGDGPKIIQENGTSGFLESFASCEFGRCGLGLRGVSASSGRPLWPRRAIWYVSTFASPGGASPYPLRLNGPRAGLSGRRLCQAWRTLRVVRLVQAPCNVSQRHPVEDVDGFHASRLGRPGCPRSHDGQPRRRSRRCGSPTLGA